MEHKRTFYYGWYIVFSCAMIAILTVGLRLGVGPFVDPIIAELGFSRTNLSFVVAVGMIFYGIGMPIASSVSRMYNTKIMMLSGVGIVTVSIIWSVNTTNYWSFMLAFGILLSIGLAFLSNVSLSPIISKWFVRERGKALFYLASGGMAGLAIMTPLEVYLIIMVGWKSTLLILGAIFILVIIPTALFIIKENVPEGADSLISNGQTVHQKNLSVDPGLKFSEAVKTSPFWKIVIGLFACGFGMNLLGSHGIPMLTSHGFSNGIASYSIGAIGFTAIFGSIFLGQLADRVPRRYLLSLIYFVRGLGFVGIVFTTNVYLLFALMICCGLVWAGSSAMSTAILGDLYGTKLLGPLNGWAYLAGHQIGSAAGAFMGGWIYDVWGTYFVSFAMAAALCIMAAAISISIPSTLRMPVKIGKQIVSN